MEANIFHFLALSLIKGLGPVSARNLISYCGGEVTRVFSMPKGKLMRVPGIGYRLAKIILEADTQAEAEKEIKNCEDRGIRILTYLDPAYPNSLKYIHDAPLILFKKGNVDLNAQANVAIVGTRKPTTYGKKFARIFAEAFAQQGINVVSGLAYGIDITAHRSVLKQSGVTTAVLGHGLDRIYPASHSQKAFEMLSKGALLSEYPTGTKPDPQHFPARNRIVSGMSKAVIVIESSEKGGALITARQAFDQNREVYAIPGRIGDTYSTGNNRLIQDNVAKLVTCPEEVLEDLGIAWKAEESSANRHEQLSLIQTLSAEESKVMNFLNQGDALVDQINLHTKIPMGKLNALLLTMEFKGLLEQIPGKKFRIL